MKQFMTTKRGGIAFFKRKRGIPKEILLSAILITITTGVSFGQCPTDLLTGQNLVTNGDFSGGYAGWTYTADPNRTNGYQVFNPPVTQSFSSPGFIWASTNCALFNASFGTFQDHSPSSDNMMLMVDGICTPNIKLWSQSNIPIKPNTNYYFSIWVHAMKDNNSPPGTLQFDINGQNLPTTITAPTMIADGWIQYEALWYSGTSAPSSATISIENTTLTGCDNTVDFAVDDITFIPGCKYGAVGPQPDLGPDQTFCGKGSNPITLNANVPVKSTTQVTWSTGATGIGTGAPYSINVTTPGTYSVCVTDAGSCVKSDVIVITNSYNIELGGPYDLCNPISQLLDAQFSGIGVTYSWFKEQNGQSGWQATDSIPGAHSRTYTVTSPGTYRVVVNDVKCGTKEDVAIVTTSATAIPKDVYFCPPNKTVNLSVTGSGTFDWYTSPTGGSPVKTNSLTYTTPPLNATTIYYVEDSQVKTTTVGAKQLDESKKSQTQISDKYMTFDASQAFTIDSVTVYMWLNNFNPTDPISIQFRLTDNPVNSTLTPSTLINGAAFSMTNATANAAGLIKPAYPTKTDNIYAVRVPVKINVPSAGSYRLTVASQNPTNTQIQTTGGSYPYDDIATGGDIISITSSKLQNNPPTLSEYHGMFNWSILYKSPCGRTPVRAIALCPLPVDITEFDAAYESGYVLLTWATAWEKNNDYYIIERSSDGINYEALAQVKGKGTSGSGTSYIYKDTHPLNGVSYYRLIQVDIDGTASGSPAVAVNNQSANVLVSPNPNDGSFRITFAGDMQGGRMVILNSLGQVVYEEVPDEKQVVHEINIRHLNSGIYYLQITGLNTSQSVKIVKE